MPDILIIKFGAIGDVLRTTPLLRALKKHYPQARISWLTHPQSEEVLKCVPLIDALYVYSPAAINDLKNKYFDISICLDKDYEAVASVMQIPARQKEGFGLDVRGELMPLTEKSTYAVRLGIDDELKFHLNQKTYQQISFEQAGFSFSNEEYCFEIPPQESHFGEQVLNALGILPVAFRKRPLVGLNTGSGPRFAGKKLPLETYLHLSERLQMSGCDVLLLGGSLETERNEWIIAHASTGIYNAGTHHSIIQFSTIVGECDLIITGDTLAMHIAIARQRKVLAFFASTCAQEIELYGRGEKLISSIECGPCYLRHCSIDEKCMKEFSMDWIVERSLHWIHTDKKMIQ